jgi:hypothetical protein
MRHALYLAMVALLLSRIAAAEDKPIDAALAEKITITSERTSLADAIQLVVTKIQTKHPEFAIEILGKDLQAEGITRNQTLRDLKYKDVTAAEVLTSLVMQANPAPLLDSATDPRQKLIWVVVTDPKDAKRSVVYLTTRAAAARRGDELPKVFAPKAIKQ